MNTIFLKKIEPTVFWDSFEAWFQSVLVANTLLHANARMENLTEYPWLQLEYEHLKERLSQGSCTLCIIQPEKRISLEAIREYIQSDNGFLIGLAGLVLNLQQNFKQIQKLEVTCIKALGDHSLQVKDEKLLANLSVFMAAHAFTHNQSGETPLYIKMLVDEATDMCEQGYAFLYLK